MHANQFNTLDDHQKTEIVLKSVFLADRLTENYYIKLYNRDNFYIEVYFDDHTNLITHFCASERTLFIMPYLEDLKLAV